MTHKGSSKADTTNAVREIAARIEQQRERTRDFVDAQNQRTQGIERRLVEQLTEVDHRLDQWEDFQSETERQHVELDEQRQALEQDRAEVESRLAEVEHRDGDHQAERERVARESEQRQLEFEQLKQQLNERECQLESTRQQLDEIRSSNSEEVDQLRNECARLQDEIQALDQSESVPKAAEELEALRARLESALDDVRSLKCENQELQERLQQAPSVDNSPASQPPEATFSWEEHKQRLLSEMDCDEDDAHEPWDEGELSIADEAIRVTDEVVARLEREMDTLRSELVQQRELADQAAERAPLIPPVENSVLDDDELIEQERERLRQLQSEWTEKLRRAEVEIAVERAQNARQQSELDEKMRDLQAELDRIRLRGESGEDSTVHARLMKRLGLGGKK